MDRIIVKFIHNKLETTDGFMALFETQNVHCSVSILKNYVLKY